MGDIDYSAILRKLNGNFAKVIDEDSGRLVTRGIVDYNESNGRIEVKVGRDKIPKSALADICEGCEGAATPIIFVSGEYEIAALR